MQAIEFYKSLHQPINAYSPELATELEKYITSLQFKDALSVLEQIERQLSGSDNE